MRVLQSIVLLGCVEEGLSCFAIAYLIIDNLYDLSNMSPHLMKHVRGLAQYPHAGAFHIAAASLDLIRNMIRNKVSVIEEINFDLDFLDNAELLDDTLRRVRSFKVRFVSGRVDETEFDLLARSFERTKAEGGNLERVSIVVSTAEYFSVTALETIIQSRPNLQVLNLQTQSWHDFVPVCKAVASSTLTAFICNCCDRREMSEEGAVDIVGKLVQHSTIRDF